MGDEPARALGDPGAQEQDDEADAAADEEGDAPAIGRVDPFGAQERDREEGAERGADPERAVDDEVGPAAHPGRDQLLDGRVDRGVLAANAGSREEAEQAEAPDIPRQARGRGGDEVEEQRDEEQLLAPDPVGQPAEADGADDRTDEVGTRRQADIELGEGHRRLAQRADEGAGQGDFEPVEHPGDAERDDDEGVEAAEGQAVKPGGDVGVDDRAGGDALGRRGPGLTFRSARHGPSVYPDSAKLFASPTRRRTEGRAYWRSETLQVAECPRSPGHPL